jgi:CHAT domain-containing protein/tetratricopeptide (TPR) repeat protein
MLRLKKLFFIATLLTNTFCSIGQTLEQRYAQLDVLARAQNYDEVLSLEGEIIPLVESRQDTLAAATISIFAEAHYNSEQYDKAIFYWEQERIRRISLNEMETETYSEILFNLTNSYSIVGRYRDMRTRGEELLRVDEKIFGKGSTRYAESLTFYLDVLINLGNVKAAKSAAAAGLNNFNKKEIDYALILNKYADLHNLTGEYTRSEKYFQESLKILRADEGNNALSINTVSVNMGNLYVNEGRIPEAEKLFSTAETFYQSQLDNPEVEYDYYSTLNNRANALHSLSLYENAVQLYKIVLRHDSIVFGTDHPNYATTLTNLANTLISQGEITEARTLLRSAVEIAIVVNGPQSVDEATRLNNIANTYTSEGQYDSALSLYQQARSIYLKELGESSLEYSTTEFNIGKALMGKNSPDAKPYLENALKLRRKLLGVRHPRYGEVLQKLALTEWRNKKPLEANDYFTDMLKNYYAQIEDYFPILSEEEKSKFYFSKFKIDQEAYISFVLDRFSNKPEELGKLYDLSLNTKGIIFYATQKVRQAILQSNDPKLISEYDTWISLKEQLAKAFGEGSDKALKLGDSLSNRANELEKKLVVKSAEFKNVFVRKTYSWKQVQAKLKPGEAAVEVLRFRTFTPDEGGYFIGRINYMALILTPETKTGPRVFQWASGGQMEGRMLSFYRNTTKFQLPDSLTYNLYWKPLRDELKGVTKVFFSPDGVFNQINPNTLYNPKTKKYLVDELLLELKTNTRDILEEPKQRKSKSGAYLFGFPDYKTLGFDEPEQEAKSERSTRAVNRSLRSGLLRGFLRGDGIPPLPATKIEVENIANEFKTYGTTSTTLLAKQANEGEMKKIKSPPILHIATHGFFLDDGELSISSAEQARFLDNPLFLSGLILASATTGEGSEDGILTAYEAMNMSLEDTELVVLSACETGLGTVKNGEGVFGLQRAFLVAGAKTVIMSLWSVDDQATQMLMNNFYNNWLKGMDKHEAFLLAQQDLRKKYAEPFYWGAFIMIGE